MILKISLDKTNDSPYVPTAIYTTFMVTLTTVYHITFCYICLLCWNDLLNLRTMYYL